MVPSRGSAVRTQHSVPAADARRLFVAWRPPAATLDALEALIARWRAQCPGAPLRWQRRGQLHLTLRFLGAVDATGEAALRVALAALAASRPPVDAQVVGRQWLPSPRAPRVLALRLDAPAPDRARPGALAALGAAVEAAAVEARFAAERRAFRAHLTVARAARTAHEVIGPRDAPPPIALRVDHLALMASERRADGAVHAELARWPLAGAPPA